MGTFGSPSSQTVFVAAWGIARVEFSNSECHLPRTGSELGTTFCTLSSIFPHNSFFLSFRERVRGRYISVREKHGLVSSHIPQPGTWPETQACALTGN